MKNNKNTTEKTKGKKNLKVVNRGDYVIIKNRAVFIPAFVGIMVLVLAVMTVLNLREAWNLPAFWCVMGALIVGTTYSVASTIFGKIVLDSPRKCMIVYSPFGRSYKFDDINYIDRRTDKGNKGKKIYVVDVYIGNGKRSVRVASYSKAQADEIEVLMRGMLKSGALIHPEGDEEPFNFDKKKKSASPFSKRVKKPIEDENPENTQPDVSAENVEAPDNVPVNDEAEQTPDTTEESSEENNNDE